MAHIILGIDPGMALMGYGLIDDDGGRFGAVAYGALSTHSGQSTPERLSFLYKGLNELLELHRPSEVAVELFVARNLRTALMVGQARGVAILAAANRGIPVFEYTPAQVKMSVSGYGRGDKRQVQEMVRLQLGLETIPEPDDAADALAVAICHSAQRRMAALMERQ